MKIKRDQLVVSAFVFGHATLGIGAFAALMWLFFLPILLTNKVRLSTLIDLRLAPFFLLLAVAIVSTVLLSPFAFNPYFIGRDLFYFSSAIVMLIIGYNFGLRTTDPRRLLWAIAMAMAIATVVFFIPSILSGAVVSFSITARYEYELDSNLGVLALLIVLATLRTGLTIGTRRLRLALVLGMIFLVAASLSRVNVLILAAGMAMMFFRSHWVSYGAMSLVVVVVAVPFLSHGLQPGAEIYDESTGFLQKLAGSLSEIAIQDQYDEAGINLHWRGYEASLGVTAVNQNGWLSVVAGLGLGSYVEGPFIDKLNIIPIFHNGFVTVYVKAGVLGLLIFVYFLFRQAFPTAGSNLTGLTPDDKAKLLYFQKLAGLMGVSLALRTVSTHGIIFPTPPLELLVLGILHGARAKIVSKNGVVRQAKADRSPLGTAPANA